MSTPLIDENLPTGSEIAGSTLGVVDDIYPVVQPNSSLNSDVPQRSISDAGTNVNVIMFAVHSPINEKPSVHNVDPTTIEETRS
ncbi:unnamed protein product, partial [Citrullus colocynthis]